VSRIDEALRRMREREGGTHPETGGDSPFVPAWTVSTQEHHPPSGGPVAVATPEPLPRRRDGSHAVRNGGLRFASEWRERLVGGSQSDPTLVEQFRRLAATLHHAHHANGLRSLMVTSAAPNDGKTLTSVNLGLALAESYRYSVLLVDADLRRPSLQTLMDLGGDVGLSEALRAPLEQPLALVPLTPRLTLLPAGQPIANSIEALTSPRMQQILEEAATRFDWVLLDAPPVGSVTDAHLLSRLVGTTLFVIHAGKTPYGEVQSAIDALGRERILGVVLNAAEVTQADGYYGQPRDGD
jgi:protein-tyrosine kinase